jgi:hypothetical protein
LQTLVKQGLALARGRDEIRKQRRQTDLYALIDSSSATMPTPDNLFALPENAG